MNHLFLIRSGGTVEAIEQDVTITEHERKDVEVAEGDEVLVLMRGEVKYVIGTDSKREVELMHLKPLKIVQVNRNG